VIIIVCTYPRDWLWHCLLNMETVKWNCEFFICRWCLKIWPCE